MKFLILLTVLLGSLAQAKLLCMDYFRVPVKYVSKRQFHKLGYTNSSVFVSPSQKRFIAKFTQQEVKSSHLAPAEFRFLIDVLELTDSGPQKLATFEAPYRGGIADRRDTLSEFHFITQSDGSEFLVFSIQYSSVNEIAKHSVMILQPQGKRLNLVAEKTFSAPKAFLNLGIHVQILKKPNGDTEILMSDLGAKTMDVFGYKKGFYQFSTIHSHRTVLANNSGNYALFLENDGMLATPDILSPQSSFERIPYPSSAYDFPNRNPNFAFTYNLFMNENQFFHAGQYNSYYRHAYLEVYRSDKWQTVYKSKDTYRYIQPVTTLENHSTSYLIEGSDYANNNYLPTAAKLLKIQGDSIKSYTLPSLEKRNSVLIRPYSAILVEKDGAEYLVTYNRNLSQKPGVGSSVHVFKLTEKKPELHSQLNFPYLLSDFQILKNGKEDFQIFGTEGNQYILVDLFP